LMQRLIIAIGTILIPVDRGPPRQQGGSAPNSSTNPSHFSQSRLGQNHLSPSRLSPSRLSQSHLSPRHLSLRHLSPRHLSPRHLNPRHARKNLIHVRIGITVRASVMERKMVLTGWYHALSARCTYIVTTVVFKKNVRRA